MRVLCLVAYYKMLLVGRVIDTVLKICRLGLDVYLISEVRLYIRPRNTLRISLKLMITKLPIFGLQVSCCGNLCIFGSSKLPKNLMIRGLLMIFMPTISRKVFSPAD